MGGGSGERWQSWAGAVVAMVEAVVGGGSGERWQSWAGGVVPMGGGSSGQGGGGGGMYFAPSTLSQKLSTSIIDDSRCQSSI